MAKKKTKYLYNEDIREFLYETNLGEGAYESRINEIKDIISNDISKRKEKCLIKFTDNIEKEITLGNYLSYLIVYEPLYVFDGELKEEYIFDISNINELEKYFDRIIEEFGINNYTEGEEDLLIGEILTDVINQLNDINCLITKNFGPTVDLQTFIDLANRNEEFNKILYEPTAPDDKVFDAKTIVQHTNKIQKDLERIICNDDKNTFKYFIESGSGVNMKQFAQVFGFIGLKPDLKEKIIPKAIDSNFCLGLKDITHFYINCVGCLKALITSHIQTKNSGYFTRKLEILLVDEYINDVNDCGTKHLVPLTITDESMIKHLNFRNYSLYPNGKNLKTLSTSDDNSNLIGKTIYLRDPITCACEKGICKKCYGDLYKENIYMHAGIIACLLLTNQFTQTVLSTKHLLQAKVFDVEYSEDFKEIFNIDLDKIEFKPEYKDSTIIISELDSNEESIETEYQFNKMTILHGNEKIEIEEEIPFSLNSELNDVLMKCYNEKTGEYIIKPKYFEDLDYLCTHTINNDGLSRVMILVQSLIDKNNFIAEHDVFETYETFVGLIRDSGFPIDYIHLSVIIKNMMEVIDGREMFKNKDLPEIKLRRISDAIQYNSDSCSKPLLFENVKKQLFSDVYGTLDKDSDGNGFSNYDVLLNN